MSKLPAIEQRSVSSWGGMSAPAIERRSENLADLTRGAVLTRGLGRSYGDASLPPRGVHEVAGSALANRLLSFDATTGRLRAEAGLSLSELKRVFVPRGWFSPVSPGTQFVTLGGMVASDVHGKGHHVAGTLGRHVHELTLRVADGRIVTCSRTEHPDLFFATLGGMGLTGHILEVDLALRAVPSPWVWRESLRMPHLDEMLDQLEASARDWPMTACWVDTLSTGANLGRGQLMRGRWATAREAPAADPAPPFSPTVPFYAPSWTLNDTTMRLFNFAYYWKQPQRFVEGIVSLDAWWYPLDAIQHWNRVYGRRGFTQHQCIIPREAGRHKVREYIELIARRGGSGFLCVIKDCGPEGEGLLSFPRPGVSVALDLPVNERLQDLVDALNRFVIDVGGRIYLTKDGYTRREHFEAMEGPRLPRFNEVRRRWDPDLRLRSALSVRLFGDPAEGT